MPKKKTCKAAAKRFKLSSKGKVMFKKAGSGHLMSSKNSKRKRHLKREGRVHKTEEKRLSMLLSS